MKYLLIFLFSSCTFISSAQTSIPGGAVSGSWNLAGSPYQIQGSIQVPNGSTLTIDPGVEVVFQDNYQLQVNGRLLAIGTISDSIIFTAADTNSPWSGIRFPSTAVTNDSSKIVFCKLEYSKATGSSSLGNGGALNFTNFSKAIVSHCQITNCSALYDGGAIYCSSGSPLISHNTISNNYCSYGRGAGIYCIDNSDLNILNNTISGNVAYNNGVGGGIYAKDNTNLTISHNTILNNTGRGGGGGIACSTSYESTISNNTISYNSATYDAGGGIFGHTNSGLTVSHNIISNNTSLGGGGMSCSISNNTTISNNTFTNNLAHGGYGFGGALFFDGASDPMAINNTVSNNTISNNDATWGGAVFCRGSSSPVFRNCILWNNTGTYGDEVSLFDESSDPSFYYCDIQGGTNAFELNSNFYTGDYQSNLSINPLFAAPSGGIGTGFDGVMADWSLQSTSPCIDSGDPINNLYSSTDLTGNARVVSCVIDMGAYEYQGGLPVPTITTNGITDFCEGGSVTLTSSSSDNNVWSPNGETTQSINVSTSGHYAVAISDNGCLLISDTVVVQVNPLPEASFYFSVNAFEIVFADISSNGNNWTWDFGDGFQTNVQNPIHTYANANTYEVCLITSNDCGADTTCQQITVECSGSFDLTAVGNLEFCDGDSVLLQAQTGLTDYNWNTGATSQSIYVLQEGDYYTSALSGGCEYLSDTISVSIITVEPTIEENDNDLTCPGDYVSYQWYLNDTIIQGATSQTITAQSSGNYTVEVVDDNGCVGISYTLEFTLQTGITENGAPVPFSVYPNPNNGVFRLDMQEAKSYSVEILNSLGQSVFTQKYKPNDIASIELTSTGVYLLRVFIEDAVYVRKVVKK